VEILIITVMALVFGVGLAYAARRFAVEGDPLVDEIDALLPQTQCGQCGYPGCRPYAQALADSDADINRCPPGGEAGMRALAELLGREPKPLAGGETVAAEPKPRLALIDEDLCIGCTKCLQVCPVDAIVGAAKQRHTVIESYCTGCELCLPPLCPVPQCIVMVDVQPRRNSWKWSLPVELGTERAA
jgi:Na+-translocating ferredoxin:NAD+ oxidoreductase subunit B